MGIHVAAWVTDAPRKDQTYFLRGRGQSTLCYRRGDVRGTSGWERSLGDLRWDSRKIPPSPGRLERDSNERELWSSFLQGSL